MNVRRVCVFIIELKCMSNTGGRVGAKPKLFFGPRRSYGCQI